MANPRIDDLRRRLDREPGSRLFGQLAEELRKDGELVEAIRVARTGLAAHPNYPSARMTLGRALFDTGDLAAARGELELVLRGAPENILASRMLAECLEGLGDLGAALLQFRAALRLAPGDRQTEQQIRALEQRLAGAGGSRPVAAAPPPPPMAPPPPPPVAPPQRAAQAPAPVPLAPTPVPTPPAPPPPPRFAATVPPLPPTPPPAPPRSAAPPDPAADFDDVFETAPSWQRASTPADVPAPEAILLLEDDAPTLPAAPHPAPRPAEALAPPTEARPPQPPPPPVEFPRAAPPAAPAAPVPPALAPPVVAPPATPPPLAASAVRPDTLAFAAPLPLPPQAPLTLAFEPTPVIEPDYSFEDSAQAPESGADTLAGKPAYSAPPEPSLAPAPPVPPPPLVAAPPATPPPVAPLPTPPVAPAVFGEPEGPPQVSGGEAHAEAAALSTSTLAELYFDQGFSDKAIQVYEELLEREPQNDRARARLIEIKGVSRHGTEALLPDPRAERRLVLQRKIARLEELLAAVRRG